MELEETSFQIYSLVLFSLIIMVFVSSYILSINTGIAFFTWINAAGTMGSILLSGLLVYLYFQMGRTQEKQFEIQRIQADLMRDRQEPWLKVESIDIMQGTELAEKAFENFNPDEEEGRTNDFYNGVTGFLLEISNRGNGPAYDLELNAEGYVLELPLQGPPTSFTEHGFEFYSQHLDRVGDNRISMAQPLMGEEGPAIQAGETDKFRSFVGLTDDRELSMKDLNNFDSFLVDLHDVANQFDEKTMFLVEISIGYEYAGKNSGEEILYRVFTPVEEATTLREIDNFGRPLPDYLKTLID